MGSDPHEPTGHIGTLICWDQWYPEAARLTALQVLRFCFTPLPSVGFPRKARYGETQLELDGAMKGHAVCNGVCVAAANRIGLEPNPSGKEASSLGPLALLLDLGASSCPGLG